MAKKNTSKSAGCLRCASADDIERQLINYAAGIIGLRKKDENAPDLPPDGWVQKNIILDGRCGYLTSDDESRGFYVLQANAGQYGRYDVPERVTARPSRNGKALSFQVSTKKMAIIRANPQSYPPIISIRRYSGLIAQCYTALSVNIVASSKAMLLGVDKNQKDAFEDYLMDLYGGKPVEIFERDQLQNVETLDISAPFIADQIHALIRTLEGDARREMGGVTPPQYKAERTQGAEVYAAIGESIDLVNQIINTGNADLEACGAPYEFYNRGYSARYDEETADDSDDPDEMEEGTDET